MTRIIAFNFVVFLSWQTILLNYIAAQDEILYCKIRNGEEEIHLTWKKTKQLLANENLPIWIANHRKENLNILSSTVEHELKRNFIKENIGNFIFYHDEEKSSAVVFREETKTIHGIIDTRYLIQNLPINECNLGHKVGGDYVIHNEINIDFHKDIKPLDLSVPHNEKNKFKNGKCSRFSLSRNPNKRQRLDDDSDEGKVTTFYPEILLFVPYDVVNSMKDIDSENYLTMIVWQYIIFFNSIDMMFAKLSTENIKIHINLAGIVIEGERNVFSFMKPVNHATPNQYLRYFDVHLTLRSTWQYMQTNRDTFPEDSFDYIFISTSDILWSDIKNERIPGLSGVLNIYAGRKSQSPNRNLLTSAIYKRAPCDFVIASHEIAHLMSIHHEAVSKGYHNDRTQCYAVMTTDGFYCQACLKWSDQSVKELEIYSRTNRNRCFLLNTPRSLYPHGNIMRTLSPSQQCRCYGFEPRFQINSVDNLDEVPETDCNQNLICGRAPHQVNTILPLDGTPCAANKVCWNKVCQDISNVPLLGLLEQMKNKK
ncbi:hypothetical protein PV327_002302 [Microctonus hyperodae]|uniref:Peptidase M12B domain-containing protein n=1 Tax=Microctonus hyperodae TaxID=165561 RepID=A0AA39FFL4_MICHY|nr:hypothetical protein PV327_002302 [Microctonus hyperodae]